MVIFRIFDEENGIPRIRNPRPKEKDPNVKDYGIPLYSGFLSDGTAVTEFVQAIRHDLIPGPVVFIGVKSGETIIGWDKALFSGPIKGFALKGEEPKWKAGE